MYGVYDGETHFVVFAASGFPRSGNGTESQSEWVAQELIFAFGQVTEALLQYLRKMMNQE